MRIILLTSGIKLNFKGLLRRRRSRCGEGVGGEEGGGVRGTESVWGRGGERREVTIVSVSLGRGPVISFIAHVELWGCWKRVLITEGRNIMCCGNMVIVIACPWH